MKRIILQTKTNDQEEEKEEVRVKADDNGRLITANQVTDYIFRDLRLRHNMLFTDFVRCFKLEKKKRAHKRLQRRGTKTISVIQ